MGVSIYDPRNCVKVLAMPIDRILHRDIAVILNDKWSIRADTVHTVREIIVKSKAQRRRNEGMQCV